MYEDGAYLSKLRNRGCLKWNEYFYLSFSLRLEYFQTQSDGLTGNIEFDENDGTRINVILHHSRLSTDSEFIYAGDWDSKTNVITTENNFEDRSTAVKLNTKIRVSV